MTAPAYFRPPRQKTTALAVGRRHGAPTVLVATPTAAWFRARGAHRRRAARRTGCGQARGKVAAETADRVLRLDHGRLVER